MAVLRPDQAQLTFAAELGPGGDLETGATTDVSGGAAGYLYADGLPGARNIDVVTGSGTFIVGDFIRIGNAAASGIHSQKEIRRIERIGDGIISSTNSFTLDRPLAFFHNSGNSGEVVECVAYTALSGSGGGEAMVTWVPGVYETVDTPDPTMAIEPRYFLGTQSKRNFFMAYKGQQTFNGSLNGIVLLNGWPLRFPFGKVVTVGGTTSGTAGNLSVSTSPGELFITASESFAVNDYLMINRQASPNTDTKTEMRRVVAKTGTLLKLNAPLEFRYTATSPVTPIYKKTTAGYFYHHILETIDLSSMSWNVRVGDSDEEDARAFSRRYVGGKVGSASISAEEGGLVNMNWDNVVFMDMIHNQQLHATSGDQAVTMYGTQADQNDVGGGDVNMPGFAIMHDIRHEHLNNALASSDPVAGGIVKDGFQTDEPYYFSQGTVTFWGQEFARIRSFNLTVNNNEDPRYYINGQFGRHRGPSEIREQRREYGMSCILALPDTADMVDLQSGAKALNSSGSLFRELLLEGTYDTTTMKGFKVSLSFEKSNGDAIRIYLPGLSHNSSISAPVLAASLDEPTNIILGGQGNDQGCFIRSAAHNIGGEAPLQVDAEILFRNLHIIIKDKNPLYP